MFRENVLIALTLLVTILLLSYIILLTMYMQINDTERRLKAYYANNKSILVLERKDQDQEQLITPDDEYLKNMAIQQVLIDNERSKLKNQGNTDEDQEEPYEKNNNNYFQEGRWINPSANSIAQPDPDFGFIDDPHPPNAIKLPYQVYGSNGHLTLRVPDAQTHSNISADLTQDRVLLDIVKMVREYITQSMKRTVRKMRDSLLDSSPQDGYIWFKQNTLEKMANKSGVKTDVNDSSLYDKPPVYPRGKKRR